MPYPPTNRSHRRGTPVGRGTRRQRGHRILTPARLPWAAIGLPVRVRTAVGQPGRRARRLHLASDTAVVTRPLRRPGPIRASGTGREHPDRGSGIATACSMRKAVHDELGSPGSAAGTPPLRSECRGVRCRRSAARAGRPAAATAGPPNQPYPPSSPGARPYPQPRPGTPGYPGGSERARIPGPPYQPRPAAPPPAAWSQTNPPTAKLPTYSQPAQHQPVAPSYGGPAAVPAALAARPRRALRRVVGRPAHHRARRRTTRRPRGAVAPRPPCW